MEENNNQNQQEEQIDLIARTVVGNSYKLEQQEEQIDITVRTVVGNSDRLAQVEDKLNNFVTKEDHQEVMNSLDKLVSITEKKDQELTMIGRGFGRHEDRIKTLEDDMKQIKPAVGLV